MSYHNLSSCSLRVVGLLVGLAASSFALVGVAQPNDPAGTSADHGDGSFKHHKDRRADKRFPLILNEMQIKVDERFASIDTNNDSVLSAAELEIAKANNHKRNPHRKHHGKRATKHNMHHKMKNKTPEQRAAARAEMEVNLFNTLDVDNNEQLSRQEASQDKRRAAKHKLRGEQRFAHMDSNNSGVIEREEFGQRLQHLRAADADADGVVTKAEMRAMRKARHAASSSSSEPAS